MDEAEEVTAGAIRLEHLVEAAPVGLAISDDNGTIRFMNAAWRSLSGFDGPLPARLGELFQLVHPQDRESIKQTFQEVSEAAERANCEVRVDLPDDQVRHVKIELQAIRPEGGAIEGYAISLSDVTDLAGALADARRSEERFRLVTENLPIGIFRVNARGRLFWANPWLAKLGGYSVEATAGIDILAFTHPDDMEEMYLRLNDALLRKEPFESHHRFINHDGTIRRVIVRSVPLCDEHGHILEHVGSLEDVTVLHTQRESLAHEAAHDRLTSLPNRSTIVEVLEDLCNERTGRNDIGVIFLDLDGFKDVNDSYGHQAGDDVLVEVSRRLTAALRGGDSVGRFGGDEFVVVCPGVGDPDSLAAVAQRLRDAIESSPVGDGERSCAIGVSIGTAMGPGDEGPDELLRRADAAMYEQKRLRNR